MTNPIDAEFKRKLRYYLKANGLTSMRFIIGHYNYHIDELGYDTTRRFTCERCGGSGRCNCIGYKAWPANHDDGTCGACGGSGALGIIEKSEATP